MTKKLWLALVAVVAVAGIGFGTTMALFSDTVSNTGNTFTAGKLCLNSHRNDSDSYPGPMFYITAAQGKTPSGSLGLYPTGLWAPGDSQIRTLQLENPENSCSSMAAWLTTVQATLEQPTNPDDPTVAAWLTDMEDKLDVEVSTPMLGTDKVIATGKLSDFLAGPIELHYATPFAYGGDYGTSRHPLIGYPGSRQLHFEVTFDRSAGNVLQGKSLVVTFTVNAVQAPNNKDYD